MDIDILTAEEVADLVGKTEAQDLLALAASHEAMRAQLDYWMSMPAAKCAECGELVSDEFCTHNDEGRVMCLSHWVDPGDDDL